ncbi:unnamed protein product, partial [marine sediment metagenome]
LFLPMMNLPLLAEEPNQSDTDSIEQAVEAVTKLRARAKAIKERIEADLRDRKAQHKREWKDATSSDPKEVQQAEQRVGLMRRTIWALGKVTPVIAEFRRNPEPPKRGDPFIWELTHLTPNNRLYLNLSRNGTIQSASTNNYPISISSEGKIVWPSTAEIGSRSHGEVHNIMSRSFYTLAYDFGIFDIKRSIKRGETAIFLLVGSPRIKHLIMVIGNTVSARKATGQEIEKFVEISFPYDRMKETLSQAKQDSANAKHKKAAD